MKLRLLTFSLWLGVTAMGREPLPGVDTSWPDLLVVQRVAGSFPLNETSGSAFYTYALAWGVNEGLLDAGKFKPAVEKAWDALKRCVAADGRLTHVQPVGADPRPFPADSTESYGVDGFILAGTEVSRLHAHLPAARSPARQAEPDYVVPYGSPTPEQVTVVLERMLGYLESATPVRVVDSQTGALVANLAQLPRNVALDRTDFGITQYEWGVTYSGMLTVAEATGDERYRAYVHKRFRAIAAVADHLKRTPAESGEANQGGRRLDTLRGVVAPQSLDDSGAMAAAMIKAARAGIMPGQLRPWIDNYLHWISEKQFRLPDGTLARNRPHHDTLWLDDLYMSVPALAQMAALTGESRYFDDACRQILQFSQRMFVKEAGLYRHGWVQAMQPYHPNFYWGRANGWAVVAMAELLSVLPESHGSYQAVLNQFQAHVAGLAAYQSNHGTWHQLLDRPETYLETSASAMYCYAIARGINRGWLHRLTYGPMVALAWNGIAQQVNARGQVENTCVGTGMGFDPAFYFHRPVSVYAAHGYGPVLLAGAEMILLARGAGAEANINDGSLQYAPSPSRH